MLPINTKILTPNGWQKIKDIHKDDYVFNKDGNCIKVNNESKIENKNLYEIIFIDNIKIQCSIDHIWNVTTYTSFFQQYQFLSINDIIQNYQLIDLQGIYQLAIAINKPVQFKYNKKHTINPYIYGVYINSNSNGVFTDLRENLFNQLHIINDVQYIPYNYLYTSIENRLELLRGLIDSYGKINKYGYIQISIYNKQIYENISFLIHSLGYRYKLLSSKDGIYNIIIHNNDNLLFTNNELLKSFNNRIITINDHVLKIKSINNLNKKVLMKNIVVDSYICENFIVC